MCKRIDALRLVGQKLLVGKCPKDDTKDFKLIANLVKDGNFGMPGKASELRMVPGQVKMLLSGLSKGALN